MDLEKKAREAQLSVLSKYGVLADFSTLEEEELDRILKGAVPAGAAQDMTFASWCDQLLGPGKRVPVARFNDPIAGQTRLSNLAVGHDLAKSLKARDKQLQALIKTSQKEIKQLQAELQTLRQAQTHTASAEPVSDIAGALRNWYVDTTTSLHDILWEIKEIEGAIFNHQGKLNRDYRKQLVEIILRALDNLEHLGFHAVVELRDASLRKPVAPTVVLHRNQPLEDEEVEVEVEVEGFAFVVEGIQADVLEAASEYLYLGQALPAVDRHSRFNCHVNVNVSVSRRHALGEDELFHLSCFMYKLFEAMARSGDHRPRGTLREKVILCLLLSCTAPCMPARSQRPELLGLQDTFYKGYGPFASDDQHSAPNVSAGKIVEHLLRILQAQIWR